jgi:hypothetical protein
MRKFLTVATVSIAIASSAFGETSAQELFALDNDSAAETLVREHSMGDITAAQIKFALDKLSAAERKVFFDDTHEGRLEKLECMKATDSGDSAAESCAIPSN